MDLVKKWREIARVLRETNELVTDETGAMYRENVHVHEACADELEHRLKSPELREKIVAAQLSEPFNIERRTDAILTALRGVPAKKEG
jgi:hypothetical protein